jgi:hypothetical protein
LALVSSLSAQPVSFTIDVLSPSVQSLAVTNPNPTFFPDDLFDQVAAGGFMAPPPIFQLNGAGAAGPGGALIDVNAYSQGRSTNAFNQNAPSYFSLDRGSSGVAGTASAIEFNIIGGSEQSSDIFQSTYNNYNTQFRDGDGVASGDNPAAGPLGVAEPTTLGPVSPIPPSLVGDVDGIDLRPVAGAAFGTNIYCAYDQTTINTGAFGPVTSAADIFVNPLVSGYDAQVANTSGNPPAAQLYINENQISFGAFLLNDIDALVVFDNGNGI